MVNVETYSSGFVGDFKTGDNIAYNCEVLCALASQNQNRLFNKMIYIQCAAIVEACLDQIIFRAKAHTIEGVPTITVTDQNAIRQKKYDKFSQYIDVMKKYKLLDELGDHIYQQLHRMRMIRNKVHIQEYLDPEKFPKSRDEVQIFTDEETSSALRLTHQVTDHLGTKLSRPKHVAGYVSNFALPVSISPASQRDIAAA